MRIALIRPPFIATNNGSPIGVAYIAKVLREQGHNVKIFDINRELPKSMSYDKNFEFLNKKITQSTYNKINGFCKSILDFSPDVAGFSLSYSTVDYGIEMAKIIHKKVRCIVGGPQASFNEETLLNVGLFKAVVSGYGEESVIKALTEDGIISEKLIKDKDYIPDYAEIEPKFYNNKFSIVTTRGCPNNCKFCTQNYPYYYHSIENSVKQISEACTKYKLKMLMYNDSNINVNSKRTTELFKEVSKIKNLVDSHVFGFEVDKDCESYVKYMADSKIRVARIGIESGSRRERDSMNKRKFFNDDVITTVKETTKNKIVTWCQFIFCYPDQTEDDRQQTLELMQRINRECDSRYVKIFWFKFVVHHGTEKLFKDEYGVNSDKPFDWTNNFYNPKIVEQLNDKYSKLVPKNCKMK